MNKDDESVVRSFLTHRECQWCHREALFYPGDKYYSYSFGGGGQFFVVDQYFCYHHFMMYAMVTRIDMHYSWIIFDLKMKHIPHIKSNKYYRARKEKSSELLLIEIMWRDAALI